MITPINLLHFETDHEKYVYIFDDSNREATLRHIAQQAADPELDLTWFDAAELSKTIRTQKVEANGN
jgi:hypothetical protein